MNQGHIKIESLSGFIIIKPVGRIDTTNHSTVLESIQTQINEGNHSLIFDFDELTNLSSAGLRVFLQVQKSLEKEKGKMCFCNIPPAVHDIFSIAGFTSIFVIVDTLEDSLLHMSEK